METPIAVANFFIKKSLEDGQELTPMKLVKLVYISHGWFLGIRGSELLSEAVQAWKYGPVIPSVYHTFKRFGNKQITELGLGSLGMEDIKYSISIPQVTDISTLQVLEEVWKVYGKFNGPQLSTLTHASDTPWYITWYNNGGKDNDCAIIPNNLIKEHYLKKIASVKGA